jgi:hypothetical protein
MADYCSLTDIENRLTANGIVFVADRDITGSASETELTKYIDPSIVYATNLIEGFLVRKYPFGAGVGNAWLKDRAIDIAAAQCVEVGGQALPEPMKAAREFSLGLLKDVQAGQMDVPGLPLPAPMNARYVTKTVQVLNPEGGRGWPY